jgi:predicted NAD/FAD-dependent oxidoreductase
MNNANPNNHSVAIVGAGIAGLTCAKALSDCGLNVTVFDKARGPAGRTSTRRTDTGLQFDHGCQYFSPKDDRFRAAVQGWCEAGVVQPWHGRVVELVDGETTERPGSERFVGVPGMNAICKHIASGLEIQTQTRITRLERNAQWYLKSDDNSVGSFDHLVVAIPPTQAAELLAGVSTLSDQISAVQMNPCWTTMLAFSSPIGFEPDAALVQNSAISWIARNSSKPSRPDASDCWVVQASAEWSIENLEREADEVKTELLSEFQRVTGCGEINPVHNVAHRWRYAIPATPLSIDALVDADKSLVVCGDWCSGNRVESAFISGLAAADAVTVFSS